MKKTVLMLASVALAVLLVGGAAIAADIACPNPAPGEPANLCTGTNDPDTLTGTAQRDDMRGLGGEDRLRGLGGNDSMNGGDQSDAMNGGPGADDMIGFYGRDVMRGGAGNDTMEGNGSPNTMYGGAGDDTIGTTLRYSDKMFGGPGNDRIFPFKGNDRVISADNMRDVVDCGPGDRDVVVYDQGLDKTESCETRIPR